MKKQIRSLRLFNEIDMAFADFIVDKEQPREQGDTLYLAALCLSYYANLRHSALPLLKVSGQTISEFCDSHLFSQISLDFSTLSQWTSLFPKTIGEPNTNTPLILSKGLLYLNKYYQAETHIATSIQRMTKTNEISKDTQEQLHRLFPPSEQKPDWQKVAAFTALRSHFCVISGGPGTGKTSTVAKILALLLQQEPQLKIDLVAPTGKAADRLGEAIIRATSYMTDEGIINTKLADKIPKKPSTIHRYLGTLPGLKGFKHNANNRCQSDLILIDESSMVSLPLFDALLSALKDNCRIILLGDKDQLTAVEMGNVLGDLTSTPQVNGFSESFCQEYAQLSGEDFNYVNTNEDTLQDVILKLEHSYRFDKSSAIGQLAKLINEPAEDQTAEEYQALFKAEHSQVELHKLPEEASTLTVESLHGLKAYFKVYKELIQSATPEEILQQLSTLKILCATRVGSWGSETMNELISSCFFHRDDNNLYHGRCIMISRNDHGLELYNGDLGVILVKDGIPTAYFPGKDKQFRSFSPTLLPQFETAFAMTIHKSQGSEYQHVMMVLPPQEMITRQLVYTGITRARQQVDVFSEINTLMAAAQNTNERLSGLRQHF